MGRTLADKQAAVKMAGDAAKSAYGKYEDFRTYPPTYNKKYHPLYIDALNQEHKATKELSKHKSNVDYKVNKLMRSRSGKGD